MEIIIGKGSESAAVEDVQRRLAKLEYDLGEEGVSGEFNERTLAAVRSFREDYGLPEGDVIDTMAWVALVDATFTLGDRTLYLRMPYFHGNDVATLQNILNILGFSCGPEDSIFGAYTESAVREFQSNMGVDPDGIVGASTVMALKRLHRAWTDKSPVDSNLAGIGFSRAAEVLEDNAVCFYGMDSASREIAARISNLAFATTTRSRFVSADMLSSAPDPGMLMVEIRCGGDAVSEGNPVLVFDSPQTLAMRMKMAIQQVSSASGGDKRIVVMADIPEDDPGRIKEAAQEAGLRESAFEDPKIFKRNMVQHYAIIILDAICSAL